MIQSPGDPLDDAPLPRRITALEDDGHPEAFLFDPLLQVDQVFLEAEELPVVGFSGDAADRPVFRGRLNPIVWLFLGHPAVSLLLS